MLPLKGIYHEHKTYENELLPVISNLHCPDHPIAFDEPPECDGT